MDTRDGGTCYPQIRIIFDESYAKLWVMSLRRQRLGNQMPWTVEEIRSGLEEFHTVHGHYPTATEIDAYEYLPSSRAVQNRLGGLIALRKTLNMGGQDDFRTGAHSSARAHTINTRAHKIEQEVYEFLCQRFGKELVHREHFFTDDARTRSDFFVYDHDGNFCVDVFYPSDRRNLIGCLNSKLQKYTGTHMMKYPVVFLQMNRELTDDELIDLVEKKTKKLSAGQHLMGWESFQEFCAKRRPRKLI